MNKLKFNRRDIVKAGVALGLTPLTAFSAEKIRTRPIPASGEALPIVGLGTSQTFDVWGWPWETWAREDLIERFVERGASVIDSSPQYGSAEKIVGKVVEATDSRKDLFIATKVWIDGKTAGEQQMRQSAELMEAGTIDLMQVHNLRDIDVHMTTIRELQQEGFVRYSGITHWQASAFEEMMGAMKKHEPQFIQINYSLGEREAEQRLLPMAADLGIAVLINRPFMRGKLFGAVKGSNLPDWASEFANSWGQFFLKFILSHPAVTCVIPATTEMHHLEDNLDAGVGLMPDAATRAKMVQFFEAL